MSDSTLRFTAQAAEQLLAAYVTPDVVRQREEVIRLLRLQAGESALDIGSGPGFLAAAMADCVGRDGTVWGIDISEDLLRIAADRSRHREQLRFLRAEVAQLPFPEASFDVVVATQVLEYLPDVRQALREMQRVLRPGGRVLVLDTDWDSLVWHSSSPDRMRKILAVWDEHLADPYLPRTLAAAMRESGFRMEERVIIPLFNPEFSEDSFSNRMIDLIGPFVTGRQGLSEDDVKNWAQDLRGLGREGRYFFSLNRYVFIARKPG